MQRLQLNPDEKLTRKEYFKRKKKQAGTLKKRSKLTYVMLGVMGLLCVYVFTQFYIYQKANNFKYVEGDGVNKQKIYNVFYVTEGYTYDPVYSLKSINSDGFNDSTVYQNSGMHDILVAKDYVYGIKNNGLHRLSKSTNEMEMLVESNVEKITINGDRIYYISIDNGLLKYIDLQTKESKDLGITDVSEVVVDNNSIYTVQDEKRKKVLVNYDKEGQNKVMLASEPNVSYIVQDEKNIYYVNKNDGNKIYKVGKDGQNGEKISDISTVSDRGEIKEIDGSKYMFVEDNFLYYINVDDSNTLWKINLENKQKEQVIAVPVEILQNENNTVFYKVKGEMGVYLYNHETKFMSQIAKSMIKEFYVDKYAEVSKNSKEK